MVDRLLGEDRGSMLPAVAVVLLGGLLSLGLALDLGRWGAVWREAAFAADAAAEAGAAMIDPDAAYRGGLRLDPAEAEAVAAEMAIAARPRPGRRAGVQADPERVCVTVHQTFSPTLLRAVGVGHQEVTARACAVPRQG